jgi:ribosomal RNA-processing protein 12
MSQSFSALLSQLLYNQPELRPAVLKALKLMADSNLALSTGDFSSIKIPITMDPIPKAQADENVAFLRTQVDSWLSVLFNVFGTLDNTARAPIGDVIRSWSALAGEQEMRRVYQKVVGLYQSNLGPSKSAGAQGQEALGVTTTAQDLLFILLPYLGAEDAQALLDLLLGDDALSHRDNGVQKRSYKVILRLLETGRVAFDAEEVLRRLDGATDNTQAAAKKVGVVMGVCADC